MQCPNHPQSEVVGYCNVCGEFGCDECLVLWEEIQYCRAHLPESYLRQKKRKSDHRRRQRLVVHYKDGNVDYGVSVSLNPKERRFYLEQMTREGEVTDETVPVEFSNLKAVFYVKSFDGNFDKSERHQEWTPEGPEVVVEFQDGEVIHGHLLHRYNPDDPRFHLIPHSAKSNNINILVESSAVTHVYSVEEYKKKRAAEKASKGDLAAESELSQEETLGDFYFETRNYEAALIQYEAAQKKSPRSGRIRKKILAAEYNIGVNHIKRREYPKAMRWMERVLQKDPDNKYAKKKAGQLRKILEQTPASGTGDKK